MDSFDLKGLRLLRVYRCHVIGYFCFLVRLKVTKFALEEKVSCVAGHMGAKCMFCFKVLGANLTLGFRLKVGPFLVLIKPKLIFEILLAKRAGDGVYWICVCPLYVQLQVNHLSSTNGALFSKILPCVVLKFQMIRQ